jgi:cobyrinic acid a,c-diamide synthase
MSITKHTVAQRIAAYLHRQITLAELVDWAEQAIMDGDFDEREMDAVRSVVSRLGVADVRTFGLTWDDCQELLQQLGYSARVDIVTA